jgi:tetratricopeptide (TPR) repeat protein
MRSFLPIVLTLAVVAGGCAIDPFQKDSGKTRPAGTQTQPAQRPAGSGPVIATPPPEVETPSPDAEPAVEALPPPPPPRDRPKAPAATLSPASKALVSQAQAQRKKGDLPGATVLLDRALRIEPNNPLLWIEMGRLRMDQRNYPQAENMGRKALAMSVGDDRTQSMAWQLISDSLRSRGKNIQAQEATEKAKALSPD